jgi:hypothetical protein
MISNRSGRLSGLRSAAAPAFAPRREPAVDEFGEGSLLCLLAAAVTYGIGRLIGGFLSGLAQARGSHVR